MNEELLQLIEKLFNEIKGMHVRVSKLEKGNAHSYEHKAVEAFSGKTSSAERKKLRQHILDLDNIKKSSIKIKPKSINAFKIDNIVKLIDYRQEFKKGKIISMACRMALPSIRACDRLKCIHANKDYVWVQWPSGKLISYHYTKLFLMSEDDLKPKIGRELSGKIGQWEFNAQTRKWKKEGSNKEYTEDEFADIMYFETHEYAKDDGETFIKSIKSLFPKSNEKTKDSNANNK